MSAPETSSPDALYRLLADALLQGEGESVVPAANRLFELEPGSERATVALAIALMRSGRLDEAEAKLKGFVERRGETGVVLTNLAKIAAERGDDQKALELARRALTLDPNQDNGLRWWASLVRRRSDDAAYKTALEDLAAAPRAWRVQLLLFELRLEQRDVAAAVKCLRAALSSSGSSREAIAAVAESLERAGLHRELVDLVGPLYNPAMGLLSGVRLAAAHLALGDLAKARALVEQLQSHPAAPRSTELADLERRLVEASVGPASGQLDIASVPVFAPLWAAALEGAAAWLLPPASPQSRVALLAFADLTAPPSPPGLSTPTERTDLARALPLALAEALRLEGIEAYCVVPVVRSKGLVAPSTRFSLEEMLALLPARFVPRVLIAGTFVTGLFGERQVEMDLYELRTRAAPKQLRAFGKRGDAELYQSARKQLSRALADAGVPSGSGAAPVAISEPIEGELSALGAALPTFLVASGALARDNLWHPTGGLEAALAACLRSSRAWPRLLAVSTFLAGRSAGLAGFDRFRQAVLDIVTDQRSPEPVQRLAPLVHARVGDAAALNAERQRALPAASGAYRVWLESLRVK